MVVWKTSIANVADFGCRDKLGALFKAEGQKPPIWAVDCTGPIGSKQWVKFLAMLDL